MSDQIDKPWPVGDKYTHPDGTVFIRSQWGNWYGDDGTEVSDSYITFRRLYATS